MQKKKINLHFLNKDYVMTYVKIKDNVGIET